MNIIAKSTLRQDNIQDKLNKGADGIEIQLLNPAKEICLESNYKIEEYLKNCNIVTVHTPLDNAANCNYEIEMPLGRQMFIKTTELADKFSQFYGKQMNVVCHMELSIKRQQKLEIYEQNKEFLEEIATKYSNINFCLENDTARTSDIYDNVKLAKEINKPNFNTTFDVCHALMCENITGFLTGNGNFKNEYIEYMTLDKSLKTNKGVCKWIHLNNAANFGQGYGCNQGHSCIFNVNNETDMSNLLKVLNFAVQENLNSICLEVCENDYLNSQNFLQMKELCKELLLNIEG